MVCRFLGNPPKLLLKGQETSQKRATLKNQAVCFSGCSPFWDGFVQGNTWEKKMDLKKQKVPRFFRRTQPPLWQSPSKPSRVCPPEAGRAVPGVPGGGQHLQALLPILPLKRRAERRLGAGSFGGKPSWVWVKDRGNRKIQC